MASSSKPAVPLAESGGSPSTTLEKGNSIPTRAMPLYAVPLVYTTSMPKRTGFGWFEWFYLTIGVIVLLQILTGVAIGVLFMVFDPMVLQFSIDSLTLTDFRLNPNDQTLYTRFDAGITATNPNKVISVQYKSGGSMTVSFQGNNLCNGSIPEMYQGYKNSTKLHLALTGQSESGSTILSAIQQQTGNIPLDITIDVPVTIKLETRKLGNLTAVALCSLVVDSLRTNSSISVQENTCKFRAKV